MGEEKMTDELREENIKNISEHIDVTHVKAVVLRFINGEEKEIPVSKSLVLEMLPYVVTVDGISYHSVVSTTNKIIVSPPMPIAETK
jgi:hypothetical protein